jgi:hypothetical protein
MGHSKILRDTVGLPWRYTGLQCNIHTRVSHAKVHGDMDSIMGILTDIPRNISEVLVSYFVFQVIQAALLLP